ncbi:hypothetical protein CSUI_008388, partial [Cystoisospora suis]
MIPLFTSQPIPVHLPVYIHRVLYPTPPTSFSSSSPPNKLSPPSSSPSFLFHPGQSQSTSFTYSPCPSYSFPLHPPSHHTQNSPSTSSSSACLSHIPLHVKEKLLKLSRLPVVPRDVASAAVSADLRYELLLKTFSLGGRDLYFCKTFFLCLPLQQVAARSATWDLAGLVEEREKRERRREEEKTKKKKRELQERSVPRERDRDCRSGGRRRRRSRTQTHCRVDFNEFLACSDDEEEEEDERSLRREERRFIWNYHLLKTLFLKSSSPSSSSRRITGRRKSNLSSSCSPFLSRLPLPEGLLLPLLYGSIQSSSCVISAIGKAEILFIARRSTYFAGTRYRKRGISTAGDSANEVETELILYTYTPKRSSSSLSSSLSTPAYSSSSSGQRNCSLQRETRRRKPLFFDFHLFSHVQLRGSVPAFWRQTATVMPAMPLITYTQTDVNYMAARRHFASLFHRYGAPLYLLNLLQKPSFSSSSSSRKEGHRRTCSDGVCTGREEEGQEARRRRRSKNREDEREEDGQDKRSKGGGGGRVRFIERSRTSQEIELGHAYQRIVQALNE